MTLAARLVKEKSGDERRRAPRMVPDLSLRFRLRNGQANGHVIDISSVGMFVATGHPLREGSRLEVELVGDDDTLLLHASATVLRNESKEKNIGAALRFDEIISQDEMRLKDYLPHRLSLKS